MNISNSVPRKYNVTFGGSDFLPIVAVLNLPMISVEQIVSNFGTCNGHLVNGDLNTGWNVSMNG